ncbi:hypothetical protein [Leptospira borgpetersenii]|uniref:hypothetical protein n=1 Tax=Leptospira borgpetersenii TaxID=174 RepID=UPI00077316AA|nr:hypothetical protein [Leptospira borgpetersenii]MBE8435875.1 hypothetical protein [Leptospira borgpetersenii serovar Tarassovi]UVA64141.1 hypothetical protein LH336_16095 [Leptospira borgpetersenii]
MPKDFFLNEWNFFEKERIFLNPSTKQIVSLYGFRQNGAPSGLEKRGLDASIYHKTRKPTEGTQ